MKTKLTRRSEEVRTVPLMLLIDAANNLTTLRDELTEDELLDDEAYSADEIDMIIKQLEFYIGRAVLEGETK